MRIFGLIPAAGLSRRMGRPKLALPLGDRTVLEHVVAAVRAGGADEVLAVVGPATAFLRPLAEAAGARVHVLSAETPDMRATIQAGLGWLEQALHPTVNDAWLLLPADHPTLAAPVVRALIGAAHEVAEPSIFVPAYAGQRGHPTLLRWNLVAKLRQWPLDQGLNTFIRARSDQTLELPWPSDEVIRDLDTPEDYERLRR